MHREHREEGPEHRRGESADDGLGLVGGPRGGLLGEPSSAIDEIVGSDAEPLGFPADPAEDAIGDAAVADDGDELAREENALGHEEPSQREDRRGEHQHRAQDDRRARTTRPRASASDGRKRLHQERDQHAEQDADADRHDEPGDRRRGRERCPLEGAVLLARDLRGFVFFGGERRG